MIVVQSAGYSDIGKVRRANEDSYLLNESMGLYVVADGMGGHRGGDVASHMAIDIIEQYISVPSPPLASTADDGKETLNSQNAHRLVESIRLANQRIHDRAATEESFKGMGTTVSALYFAGDTMLTANVGDSPIYLIRNQNIELLSTPHTLLHERDKIPKSMVGRISEARLGHILTRAVGIHPSVEVDLVETACYKDDIIVLCSDGLSNKLKMEEIQEIIGQNGLEDACKTMTEVANERGGEDNITIIAVQIVSTKKGLKETLLSRVFGTPLSKSSLLGARKRS